MTETADYLGSGMVGDGMRQHTRHYLLVSVDADTFARLCGFGAETEDHEDTHDAEPLDYPPTPHDQAMRRKRGQWEAEQDHPAS